MIRKKKLFVRPKKAYEKTRILEENKLIVKYGLKNKREIWKALAKINYYRSRAKALAKSPTEEQKVLFGKLSALGIKVDSISDVLALKIENLLERRLPTIIAKKGISRTPKQARQMVTHKNILINGKVVNSPSYIVPLSEEKSIALKKVYKVSEVKPTPSKNQELTEEVNNG